MSRLKTTAATLACLGYALGTTPVFAAPPPGVCDNLIIAVYNDCYEAYGSDYNGLVNCITSNYADGPCAEYWTWDGPPYNYDIVAGPNGPVCRWYNPSMVYGICP